MKKLLVLPAVLLLTGCTVMDVVGPRANGEIMALAKQARADGTTGEPPEWRELRRVQGEQLEGEALRLCGIDARGETPSSCDISLDDLPASADAEGLLARTVAAADKVPEDSVDLVVAQAIDSLAAAPVRLDPINTVLTDDSAAGAMAGAESALQYGLSLALAFADDGLRQRIIDLRDASRERLTALGRVVPGGAEALAPDAGYEFLIDEPTSPEQAAQFVETLQRDLVTQWRSAAADASSADWMAYAIRLAAHAQRS